MDNNNVVSLFLNIIDVLEMGEIKVVFNFSYFSFFLKCEINKGK